MGGNCSILWVATGEIGLHAAPWRIVGLETNVTQTYIKILMWCMLIHLTAFCTGTHTHVEKAREEGTECALMFSIQQIQSLPGRIVNSEDVYVGIAGHSHQGGFCKGQTCVCKIRT